VKGKENPDSTRYESSYPDSYTQAIFPSIITSTNLRNYSSRRTNPLGEKREVTSKIEKQNKLHHHGRDILSCFSSDSDPFVEKVIS